MISRAKIVEIAGLWNRKKALSLYVFLRLPMTQLSSETIDFINEHRRDDVRMLSLKAAKYPKVGMAEAVVQISGWQIAERKVPLFAASEGILYPRHLSMEQCSSEQTARYKATLVHGDSFADLTAGFGVDCSFLARNFKCADYVERQEELCKLARHNFAVLGLDHVRVHQSDAVDYLRQMNKVDCLFLDPARRNSNGGKTVAISDCEPDVCLLESQLVEKGNVVMVKLSPMLDMASALHDLKYVYQLHVVAVNNECKELIALLKKTEMTHDVFDNEVPIVCEQVVNNSMPQCFSYTLSEEKNAICSLTGAVEEYLYEPGAALLKAGPYKLLSERYKVNKLHPNSHLYTSPEKVDFPGRCFRVIAVSGFGKKELKSFMNGVEKANLTIRNFPSSVVDLRKKLKLKEGGDLYLFATTLAGGEKVLIKCEKIA